MARVSPSLTFGFWLLALSSSSSCARPAFVLPAGPGVPAPEARTAWSDATKACRGVSSLSAELRLSGRAGARGRINARALAAFTAAGEIRLEVPAPFGRPAIILAGRTDRATLVTRDNHVLTARAPDMLEQLAGLALDPPALVALLSGCGFPGEPEGEPERVGEFVATGAAGRRAFLRLTAGAWRVAAAELPGWLVDYRTTDALWPSELRLVSRSAEGPPISLTIRQSQVEVNAALPAAAFTVAVPPDAEPITLADLRAAGPLGAK